MQGRRHDGRDRPEPNLGRGSVAAQQHLRAPIYQSDWRKGRVSPPDPSSYLPDDPAEETGGAPGSLVCRPDAASRGRRAGSSRGLSSTISRTPADVLVALVYEEFCVREEAGEGPDPHEYEIRFPAIASRAPRVD